MASDQHTPLVSLVRRLAKQGKFLSIEVHDERPASFAAGVPLLATNDMDVICCRKWGYDPTTGQRVCVEPC